MSLACGEDVNITNFGKFVSRIRPAVTKVNPKSGERIQVEEKQTTIFRPSRALKNRINQDG